MPLWAHCTAGQASLLLSQFAEVTWLVGICYEHGHPGTRGIRSLDWGAWGGVASHPRSLNGDLWNISIGRAAEQETPLTGESADGQGVKQSSILARCRSRAFEIRRTPSIWQPGRRGRTRLVPLSRCPAFPPLPPGLARLIGLPHAHLHVPLLPHAPRSHLRHPPLGEQPPWWFIIITACIRFARGRLGCGVAYSGSGSNWS